MRENEDLNIFLLLVSLEKIGGVQLMIVMRNFLQIMKMAKMLLV